MSKHFTTNSAQREREIQGAIQCRAARIAHEEQKELLKRVQAIKAGLDRKAGR